MKIISKFQDYYDSIIAYGMDPNILYIRRQQEFDKNSDEVKKILTLPFMDQFIIKLPGFKRVEFSSIYFDVFSSDLPLEDVYFIFFCGNFYVCVEMEMRRRQGSLNPERFWYYDRHSIHQAIQKYGSKEMKAGWGLAKKKKKIFSHHRGCYLAMTKMFDQTALDHSSNLIYLHHEWAAPVFLFSLRSFKLTINPCLKDIQFMKVIDPYTAFQEISMFVSGVLGGRAAETVEISDRCRKEMHGFDKWSFRKMGERR